MIIDSLTNATQYFSLNPGFERAFQFLNNPQLAELELGRHDIAGDHIFAIVAREPGREVVNAQLEVHRKYIDIQYVISGQEKMGWRSLDHCQEPADSFDSERDLGFFLDAAECLALVNPGCFAVFFPQDAHMPLISEDPFIHKVIVKVAV